MGSYLRPQSIQDALAALAASPRILLAGGTDYYPGRVGLPLDDDILDITAIPELTGITDAGDHWRLGALARWSDLGPANLPPAFNGLKNAARRVGGAQVQNAGTICGNVCNASPAADGVPNLLVLDAAVELSSAGSVRTLPVGEFVTGNRATQRRANELKPSFRIEALRAASRIVAGKYAGRGEIYAAGMPTDGANGTMIIAEQFARWLETGER